MKRIYKKALTLLLAGTIGISMTSCDSDLVNTVVNVLSYYLNPGQTYTYNGTSLAQAYVNVGTKDQKKTAETSFSDQQLQIVTSNSGTSKLAKAVLPNCTWNSIQVTGLTFYNLVLSDSTNTSTLKIGDNSTIDGSFVYNGTTYTACYAEINTAKISQQDAALDIIAQFAATDSTGNYLEDQVMQMTLKYTGTIATK